MRRTAQCGAAILTAMPTVVLVATLASAMLWQQWRGVEVETAQRTRVQSVWVLTGALDWARLILREDARNGGADHLAEPWAVPLAPARLSTFLAAERGQALVTDETDADQEAFLSGHIHDLQARLNLNNLLENNQIHEPTVVIWARLFKHLGLPESELQNLTQALQRAYPVSDKDKPADLRTAGRLLQPQSVADLPWLGLSPATLHALAPFVTVLPVRTPVNLNTAEPEVLLATISVLDMAQAQALVQARDKRHMETLMDAEQLINIPKLRLDGNLHSVASRFFSVTGQLRLGASTVQEVSVLQRDGLDVKTLSRQREVLDATMPTLQ